MNLNTSGAIFTADEVAQFADEVDAATDLAGFEQIIPKLLRVPVELRGPIRARVEARNIELVRKEGGQGAEELRNVSGEAAAFASFITIETILYLFEHGHQPISKGGLTDVCSPRN